MFHFLTEMSGITFLGFFIMLTIVCIFIGKQWINADGTSKYSLPDIQQLSPMAIAVLRDGERGAIQVALFNLWHRGFLQISGKGVDARVQRDANHPPDTPIEYEIYQFVQGVCKPRDFLKRPALQSRVKHHLKTVYRELERRHLRYSTKQMYRAWFIIWLFVLILTTVGGRHLLFSDSFHDQVDLGLLTTMLLPISIIGLIFVLIPRNNITSLGRKFLKQLRHQLAWLKQSHTDTIDPALGLAIFGSSAIAGTALYDSFDKTFVETSSGGSGGCGGCGGCAGGCGGGGCGGGGS